jgi:hypothetical protein
MKYLLMSWLLISSALTSPAMARTTAEYTGYVVNCSSMTAETHDAGFPAEVRNAEHGCHISFVKTTLEVPAEITYRTPSGTCTMVYSLTATGKINIRQDDSTGNITCQTTLRNNQLGFDIVDVD